MPNSSQIGVFTVLIGMLESEIHANSVAAANKKASTSSPVIWDPVLHPFPAHIHLSCLPPPPKHNSS